MSGIQCMVTRANKVRKNASYPKEVKEDTANKVILGIWKPMEAKKKVGCSLQAVQNWVAHKENNREFQDFSHRPSYLSPKRKEALLNEVNEISKKGRGVSKRKFGTDLQNQINETRIEEKKLPVTISKRYLGDMLRKNKLKTGNAEVESNAHEVAAKDPRHAASFAAMLHYLHSIVPEGQFINMDKTGFEWSMADQENTAAVFSGKRKQSLKTSASKLPKPNGNSNVSVYIVASDGGFIGDIVYIIKDKHMKAGAIDVYTAPMLAVSNSPGTTAHLIFVGESAPNNDEALNWVLENVVIPFGNVLRSGKNRDPNSSVSLTVDGDPRQLQVITEEHTRGMLTQARFVVGKSPASCTPIFQPLDTGKLFLASKTRFTAIMARGTTHLSDKESALLKLIFQEHLQRHRRESKKDGGASLALSQYYSNLLKCLPAVAEAVAEVPLRRVVRDSFQKTGVSPFNVAAVRNKCTYDWTSEQMKEFDRAVPELSERFGVEKELKESDFDELHIPINNKSKDGVPVHQRRALFLYAPHVLLALQEQASKKAKV